MFLKIALRNVFRQKRRTFITEFAIVTGVTVIVCLGAFLTGLRAEWRNSLIDILSGHLTLMREDYLSRRKTRPLSATIADAEACYRRLAEAPGVEAAMARLEVAGMIGNGENSTTFFGYGMDLARQPAVLPKTFHFVKSGSGLAAGDRNGAVLGEGLARGLGCAVGDSLLLATNDMHGQLNAVEVVVRGLSKTGNEGLDDNLVIFSLEAAQELLSAPGRASEINVRLASGRDPDAERPALENIFRAQDPGLTVKTWREMNPMVAQVNGLFSGIALIVTVILFIVVGAGLANTLTMSVFERVREVGTLGAMGTTPGQVLRLFLLEGLCLGGLGVLAGGVIAASLTWAAGRAGIPVKFPGASEAVAVHPALQAGDLVGAAVLIMVMSLLASALPARHAARLDPVEALRHN